VALAEKLEGRGEGQDANGGHGYGRTNPSYVYPNWKEKKMILENLIPSTGKIETENRIPERTSGC